MRAKKKTSCFDLTRLVLHRTANENASKSKRIELFNTLTSILNSGWTSANIIKVIDKNKLIINPSSDNWGLLRLFQTATKNEENLLKQGIRYYHKELTITPLHGRVSMDYNTGQIFRETENFYLEMRDSYTIDNLVRYFISKNCLYEKNVTISARRVAGSFSWLLNNYDVELVLHMIDIANDKISFLNGQKLKSVMDLQNYLADAYELITRKKTEAKLNGVEKLVPRTFSS